MSVRISFVMRWRDLVLSKDGPVTSSQRLVALALAGHMHRDGGGAYPSSRLLAEETALSRNTVLTALTGLANDAWLAKLDSGRRGKFGTTVHEYRARLPDRFNGAVSEPLDNPGNGATIEPLGESGNGSAMAQLWRNSGHSTAQPLSLNSCVYNSDASAPAPSRSQGGAAAGTQSERFEAIVRHYLGDGYPREAAERMAQASLVAAQEASRRRA